MIGLKISKRIGKLLMGGLGYDYSSILNSLKHKRYHKIWELRQKKQDCFSAGTSGMLVGPLDRSFESTLLSSFGTPLMISLVGRPGGSRQVPGCKV